MAKKVDMQVLIVDALIQVMEEYGVIRVPFGSPLFVEALDIAGYENKTSKPGDLWQTCYIIAARDNRFRLSAMFVDCHYAYLDEGQYETDFVKCLTLKESMPPKPVNL